jgi:hypothetical protein
LTKQLFEFGCVRCEDQHEYKAESLAIAVGAAMFDGWHFGGDLGEWPNRGLCGNCEFADRVAKSGHAEKDGTR